MANVCANEIMQKKKKKERKNLKAKERKCQRQKNVQKKFTKKLHVSSIFKKQNLANTLKSYAMSNLHTQYKILQKVKILWQKQKAKGINVNKKK